MGDTGYTKERDEPHQRAVAEFIKWINKTGVYHARDIQNVGLHRWARDVAIHRKNNNEPFAYVDVKRPADGRANIAVACEEHNYQLAHESDETYCLIVFNWRGFWLGGDMEWLAEHQIGGDREPTGNGSKTRFRLFGPIADAPLVSDMLARRVRGSRHDQRRQAAGGGAGPI